MLDFKKENIEKMMRAGYIDCLKAFGRVEGKLFAFNISDYHKARSRYSSKVIEGIEYAADVFGIDRYRIYKFDDLVECVIKIYKRNVEKKNINGVRLDEKQILIKFTGYILGDTLDYTAAKIFSGLISDVSNAANSISYFLMTKK